MAETNLAKKANGYNYKYTELAQINEYVESIGGSYYQYIETTESGVDYIVTVKIDKDGKESKPLRGCRIIDTKTLQGKSNPAQEMGSGITYARRYSLLMAYGLATEDNDAANFTQPAAQQSTQRKGTVEISNPTAADIDALAADAAQRISTPEKVTDAVLGQIQYMMQKKHVTEATLCKTYQVRNLRDLTAEQGENCLKRLEATKDMA